MHQEDLVKESKKSIDTIKSKNNYVNTLSNAFQKAGALTFFSDLSKLEIIRDIPIGKGGVKKEP